MGAHAEYLAVKAAVIAGKPSNPSFEEPASVPVAAQTAWQGIFTHGHLEKGQTILIHGGAGAVGACAVQLASHAGATVIATASGDDEAYLNSIGASRVIDYREAQGTARHASHGKIVLRVAQGGEPISPLAIP
jgi:NADPH:quinone reductase-like Zn-dependent oxidoreductase